MKLKGLEDDWRKGTVDRQVKSRSEEVLVDGRNYRQNRFYFRSANDSDRDPEIELMTSTATTRAGSRSSRALGSLLFGAPWTSIRPKNKRKTAPQAKFLGKMAR
jgi:hypothetical protein